MITYFYLEEARARARAEATELGGGAVDITTKLNLYIMKKKS